MHANNPSRRALLRTGAGAALAAAGLATGAPAASAASLVTGGRIRNLTGPAETGRFAAPWTDLGIPARCPDGSMLLVCGDTFDGGGVGGPDWRAPVGLRASNASPAPSSSTGASAAPMPSGSSPRATRAAPRPSRPTCSPSAPRCTCT